MERSRTDPNMLVITYTSEHNHPWPTQRNALAGSTRSQPSKTNTTTASKNSPEAQKCTTNQKEEQQQEAAATESADLPAVKEEFDQFDNQLETEDAEFDHRGFPPSYRPAMPPPESNNSEDSFVFADLGEIEADSSLDMLLAQGFRNVNEEKSLDPFSFYDDWPGNNNCTAMASAEEGSRD